MTAIDAVTDPTQVVDTVAELLARARAAGLRVRLTLSDRVQVSGPPYTDIRHELRERQGEVLAELRREQAVELAKLASWRPPAGLRPAGVPWRPRKPPPTSQRRLPFKGGRR